MKLKVRERLLMIRVAKALNTKFSAIKEMNK